MPEIDLRQEIIRFSRLCYERRLLVAMDGNLSARLPSGDVVCTRGMVHKGFLADSDLLVVDMEGRKKRGEGAPTSEIFMHLACYRARPDVHAVIHAHPPLCVALTIAGVGMDRFVLPEVVLTLGTIPTVPYETTGTQALADEVGTHMRDYDAILMDTHGAVTVGRSVLEAFCRMETLEHTALIMKTAHEMGGIRSLPEEEAIHLRRMGLERYGGPPSAVARKDEPAASLPIDRPAPIPAFADLRLARLTNRPLRTLQGPPDTPPPIDRPDPAAARQAALASLVVDEVVRDLAERNA